MSFSIQEMFRPNSTSWIGILSRSWTPEAPAICAHWLMKNSVKTFFLYCLYIWIIIRSNINSISVKWNIKVQVEKRWKSKYTPECRRCVAHGQTSNQCRGCCHVLSDKETDPRLLYFYCEGLYPATSYTCLRSFYIVQTLPSTDPPRTIHTHAPSPKKWVLLQWTQPSSHKPSNSTVL